MTCPHRTRELAIPCSQCAEQHGSIKITRIGYREPLRPRYDMRTGRNALRNLDRRGGL